MSNIENRLTQIEDEIYIIYERLKGVEGDALNESRNEDMRRLHHLKEEKEKLSHTLLG